MAELSVSRKNIYQLFTDTLKESKKNLFIIPEYQRPYKWDVEKCDILWNDIKSFHREKNGDRKEEYFLGTVVSCEEKDGIAIIDGQQRITSLFLLLRAFYTKLEAMQQEMPDDDEINGLMNQIAPCIWEVNEMSQKVKDKALINIKSLVAIDADNDTFHAILQTGQKQNGKSTYALNYTYFYDQCDKYAQDNPLDWKELCLCILKQCIILPIECKDLDSALTIFSTLNDRGMPLSDSDIFKAQIYKTKTTQEEKNQFTEDWKKLSETVEEARISLDDIFRYYTHVIRATNEDKSKEVGLRKFYGENQYAKLKEPNVMNNVMELADFWKSINLYEDTYCTLESKQYIHCLRCYPNEYWKYPLSAFYFYCKKQQQDRKELMPVLLKNMVSYLFVKFVENPTVNAIKDPIFASCIETLSKGTTNFKLSIKDDFEQRLNAFSSSKISRPMILLHAYLFNNEQELIPADFQIEHIFPKKWQNTNYFEWNKEDAEHYLDMFGNKIAFESKLNIMAGNGYFGKKKEQYANSKIKEVLSLSDFSNNDWTQADIEKRNYNFVTTLKSFFHNCLCEESAIHEILLEYTSTVANISIIKELMGEAISYIYVCDKTLDETLFDSDKQLPKERKSWRFKTIEEAINSIDTGILKYGSKITLADDVLPLVREKILSE